MKKILTRIGQSLSAIILVLAACLGILFLTVTGTPEPYSPGASAVNDVTQINPIEVASVAQPTSTEEIARLVRTHQGPISIGGARHSMGGQIGSEQSLHLDMRAFDSILYYNTSEKLIRVQTGITWRKVIEHIDGDDLSVRIMQSYADFTVGGSLSVNVHGRYIGEGPIIFSVESIRVVLADGTIADASRESNPELFYSCIGGYGAIGVITEATLHLTDNCKVKQQSELVSLDEYPEFFMRQIRNDTSIIFHNADIYPDKHDLVRATSYVRTDEPVTISDRLVPADQSYRFQQLAMWLVSEMPGGKAARRTIVDPLLYDDASIEYRNHEASANAMELEPVSRKKSTYVLQEYFVPVGAFKDFVPEMLEIFDKHEVNLINISIRHARKDPGSILAWAKDESFSFVVYYKQGTADADKQKVGLTDRTTCPTSCTRPVSNFTRPTRDGNNS